MDYKEPKKNAPVELLSGGTERWQDVIPKYEILECLGEGSLTTVYKVKREGIDEVFAAKVLRSQYASNPRTAKRFAQEAKKACALNHPHLVSVYESGNTANGLPYLICDFVDGGNLEERLAKSGRMMLPPLIDLMVALCEGLEQAHAKGVIHRDIKPGNVVFKGGGSAELAKLSDFGIAKVLPSAGRETKYLTPEGDAFGNPAYMSPEQLQGARIDVRSDIYALGCVMYECLCGGKLFTGKNSVQVALKQIQEEPDFDRWRDVGVPISGELETLLSGMLAKDPEARYQTIKAVAADLRRLKVHESIRYKRPQPKPEPTDLAKPTADAAKSSAKARTVDTNVPERPAVVFDTSMVKSSMAESEKAQASWSKRAAARVESPALTTKQFVVGCAIAGVSLGLLVGLYIGFMAKSMKTDGLVTQSPIYEQRRLVSNAPDPLNQLDSEKPEIDTDASAGQRWRARSSSDDNNDISTTSGHMPIWYAFNRAELVEEADGKMPLKTNDGHVIFWYKIACLRQAIDEAVRNGVDLSDANLMVADLHDVNFNGARLRNANLRACNLTGCSFEGADFTGADVHGAFGVRSSAQRARDALNGEFSAFHP